MKAIILAAGMGSRLGNDQLPKPMTLLSCGKSILELQIENLMRYIPRSHIVIVVGFRKELIMEAFPDLIYVNNPDFSTENTAKSLLRALKKIEGDILWINGDVVFRPEILEQVVQAPNSVMVVNKGTVGEEEVKYRTDSQGTVVEVSKDVIQGEGESLGINRFIAKDTPLLRSSLEQCQTNDYFEKGMQLCINRGMMIKAIRVEQNDCVEVDFPEDLERANRLVSQWN